ncbi:MAG: hypothetical protein KAJ48_07920 [Elusimicrobiales bacterium]|nr:hypothetical protein [Elusimicrobiales bacterium]
MKNLMEANKLKNKIYDLCLPTKYDVEIEENCCFKALGGAEYKIEIKCPPKFWFTPTDKRKLLDFLKTEKVKKFYFKCKNYISFDMPK